MNNISLKTRTLGDELVNSKIMVEKKVIPCNLCSSKHFDDLYDDELGDTPPTLDYNFNENTRKTFKIVRCRECELIFTNPMPKISSFYTQTVDETYLNSQEQRLFTAQKAIKLITKYKQSGKLLDIGCATGVFLDAAKDSFQVEGIELSQWASDIAAKKHKVYQEPLDKLNFANKYDVITLWGVIEHFEDPKSEIKEIYKALAPEGLFIVYTGDVDAWLPKLLGKNGGGFRVCTFTISLKKPLQKC